MLKALRTWWCCPSLMLICNCAEFGAPLGFKTSSTPSNNLDFYMCVNINDVVIMDINIISFISLPLTSSGCSLHFWDSITACVWLARSMSWYTACSVHVLARSTALYLQPPRARLVVLATCSRKLYWLVRYCTLAGTTLIGPLLVQYVSRRIRTCSWSVLYNFTIGGWAYTTSTLLPMQDSVLKRGVGL